MPIYEVLVAGVLDGGLTTFTGAQARIWRAIDALHTERGSPEQIRLLEEVAVELHAMQLDLRHGGTQTVPRRRIAALTDQWLELAEIRH